MKQTFCKLMGNCSRVSMASLMAIMMCIIGMVLLVFGVVVVILFAIHKIFNLMLREALSVMSGIFHISHEIFEDFREELE